MPNMISLEQFDIGIILTFISFSQCCCRHGFQSVGRVALLDTNCPLSCIICTCMLYYC